MRNDLIKQIATMSEVNHVVVLTHNIDFVFLQTVFLSALKRCGHPNLTVFADAQCARESYQCQSSMLTGLGKRYRVVPVAMSPGYRFHPKAVLLSGSKAGSLFVGSGNMTFGGMRENVEIWRRFDTGNGDFGAFSAFRDYMNGLLNRVAFEDSVKIDFAEIFDEHNHPLVSELREPDGLIGRVGKSTSLLSSMVATVANQPVSRITVSTPYFDPDGDALQALSEQFSNPPIDVLLQSKRSTLFSESAQSLSSNIQLKSIGFSDENEKEGTTRFIHAKYFAFHQPDHVQVLAGSANCSRAALLKGGLEGNAELMTYQSMSESDFDREFLQEFVVSDAPPALVNREEVGEEDEFIPKLQLVGVSYELTSLNICYLSSQKILVTGCVVDGVEKEFEKIQDGRVLVRVEQTPFTVTLKGVYEGVAVVSNEMWVDDESALRSTSKGRALLEQIRSDDNAGDMKPEDWTLIVEQFAKDLTYTTAKERVGGNVSSTPSDDEDVIYSRTDVFSDSYNKPPNVNTLPLGVMGDKTSSFNDLLLRAFGIDRSKSSGADEQVGARLEDSVGGDDQVDIPEQIKIRTDSKPDVDKKKKEKDQKKKRELVTKITEVLTDPTYLELREPRRLGADLIIVGLLLRKALANDWIDKDLFFDVTQRIWGTLFFTPCTDKEVGWIGRRYRQAEDKKHFVSALSSSQLGATLYAWAGAVDLQDKNPNTQRFLMSILVSIGRYPWLWYEGIDEEEIYEYLMKILVDSPCGLYALADNFVIHEHRISLLRQGEALARLERRLSQIDVAELRSSIDNDVVNMGEVLWQGERGICITVEAPLQGHPYQKVMCLQDPEDTTSFTKQFLMPLRQILRSDILENGEMFGILQRQTLQNFLKQLSTV